MKRIVYSRGFPYGAPLVMVRGGATKEPDVKDLLRAQGFTWDGRLYAWKQYLYAAEFKTVLVFLRALGCEVVPKSDLDPALVLDLDSEAVQA